MSFNQMKQACLALSPSRKDEAPPRVPQSSLSGCIRHFAEDTAGEIAMLFGLMAMVMFLLIGAAVDMGRWLNARDQTVAAIDAAVLAAGRTLQTDSTAKTAALALAAKYYQEGIKGRLAVKSDTVSFEIVDNDLAVRAKGNATIATPFMGVCCGASAVKELPLLATSGADYSKAVLAVGGNAETNLEIAMMLDTSGSMGSPMSKLQDMKAAAKDLVNIVVWDDQSEYTSKVSLVPFSADVRIPNAWLNQVTNPDTVAWPTNRGQYKKTVCVAERAGSAKYTDDYVGAGKYIMNAYDKPNGTCSQYSSDDEVVPMTSSKPTLMSKIDALDLGGGTAGHIGTAWAYYMLSPKWAPLLPNGSKPIAYNTPKYKKIAILMTDGEYNFTYDSQGIPTNESGGNANGSSSATQALAICNQMKQSGIDVYTVGFDLGGNNTAINTLKNCATDQSKFYNADDGTALKNAFRDIALKISTLYLSK